MMSIAVLITCHNRAETTLQCLVALQTAAKGMVVDTYLVDDGSTDGTGDRVAAMFPQITVIRGNGKLFWSRGMHRAWCEAIKKETACAAPFSTPVRYDFFLWLNDDVILDPDALVGLLADHAAVGGGMAVVAGACGGVRNGERQMFYGAMDAHYDKMIPTGVPQRCMGSFTGNCLLVPHVTYERVGMISANYTHAYGDIDYAERLKRSGVPFYASSRSVGVCEYGPVNKVKEWPLWRRLPLLFVPSMWNLHDLWLLQVRYRSLQHAVLMCLYRVYVVVRG